MKPVRRYPLRENDRLQGWDSADELILQHVAQIPPQDLESKRVLILNDNWGALSCSLENLDVTVYTDSFSSAKAIELNSEGRVHPIHRLENLKGPYHFALIKIPKNMSFFEDMLCHTSAHLAPGAKVICGYMVKHQAKASFELLNKIIGNTSTSLAQKKARLIFSLFEKQKTQSPYPIQITIEDFFPITNHSAVFSREKLDIGTRFLLEHIPKTNYKTILDLGCGNGLIGIAAKKQNPQAHIILSDDSMMAVESAKTNFGRHFKNEEAQFLWTHCYENQKSGSLDFVICNPPFHQGNTLNDSIARQMFKDAFDALVIGGALRVIGNTHLRYAQALDQIFGNVRTIATHPKFAIIESVREN
jgi:16S rRNA G1207 methylase RsmC